MAALSDGSCEWSVGSCELSSELLVRLCELLVGSCKLSEQLLSSYDSVAGDLGVLLLTSDNPGMVRSGDPGITSCNLGIPLLVSGDPGTRSGDLLTLVSRGGVIVASCDSSVASCDPSEISGDPSKESSDPSVVDIVVIVSDGTCVYK